MPFLHISAVLIVLEEVALTSSVSKVWLFVLLIEGVASVSRTILLNRSLLTVVDD